MLNYKRSARFTLWVLAIGSAALLALFIGAPFLMPFLEKIGHGTKTEYTVFLVAFYITATLGFAVIALLFKLLKNVVKERLFVTENVKLLNAVSYLCFAVVPVCFAAGFWFITLFAFSLAALFMGFVVRIVMHSFEYAVEKKEENELTV